MQQIVPLLSTIFIVISAIYILIGWRQIKQGDQDKHKRSMLLAAAFAILFLIFYLSRTAIYGNTPFGGPDNVKIFYTVFLIFHILLSTTGFVMGIITIRVAYKGNYKKHRKLGPITASVWLFTALTGVIVYLLLYVIYDPPEATSLIRAIFGH